MDQKMKNFLSKNLRNCYMSLQYFLFSIYPYALVSTLKLHPVFTIFQKLFLSVHPFAFYISTQCILEDVPSVSSIFSSWSYG